MRELTRHEVDGVSGALSDISCFPPYPRFPDPLFPLPEPIFPEPWRPVEPIYY